MRRRLAKLAHPASFLFLIVALGFIDILWVANVQAIPFTSSSDVDAEFTDPGLPGGFDGVGKNGPPNQPLVDLSLSEIRTTDKTLFDVSSVTAFVNTDGGLSNQGVAQVDTLLSPLGPSSQVSGHANFQLDFTSGDSPLAVDLSGVLHQSGATWGGLESAHVEFGCSDFSDTCVKGFGFLPEGFRVGDFPFEFHTILPPVVRAYTFRIGAENNLFGSGVNVTRETTSESRIVWNLQARPVPVPPTLLLFGPGIIGLAVAIWRREAPLVPSR